MPGGRVPPIEVILTWPTPNHIDPTTLPDVHDPVIIILGFFLIFVVCARIWARLYILRKPGWDDVFAVLSAIIVLALDVFILWGIREYHIGRHLWDVPFNLFVPAARFEWILEMLFHLSQGFIKISVFLFYRRLAVGTVNKIFIRIAQTMIWFQVVWTIVFLIVLFNACHPLISYWEELSIDPPYTTPHTCLDEAVYWTISGVIAVLTDYVAVFLPCWLVYTLQLPAHQKRLLYGIFGLGILSSLGGIFRLVFTIRSLLLSYDQTWEGYFLILSWVIEVHGTIICASAPALKPFSDRIRAQYFTTTQPTTQNSYELSSSRGTPKPKRGFQRADWPAGIPGFSVLESSYVADVEAAGPGASGEGIGIGIGIGIGTGNSKAASRTTVEPANPTYLGISGIEGRRDCS